MNYFTRSDEELLLQLLTQRQQQGGNAKTSPETE
jgi:hypothetical protein